MRDFNEIFKKDVTYDNIKSHRKPRFYSYSEKHIIGTPPPPPSCFRVK